MPFIARGAFLFLEDSILFSFGYFDFVDSLALVENFELSSFYYLISNSGCLSVLMGVFALAGAYSAFYLRVDSLP